MNQAVQFENCQSLLDMPQRFDIRSGDGASCAFMAGNRLTSIFGGP